MDRRHSWSLLTFFTVISLSVLLAFAGCGIYGSEKPEETPVKPPPVRRPDFVDDESDVVVKPTETIEGSINWSKGFIQARGYGRPPGDETDEEAKRLLALRAAKAEAYSNLAEITAGVKVTSDTTVRDMTLENYDINLKVEAVIKGAKELDAAYDVENKSAIVRLGIYLERLAKDIPGEGLPPGREPEVNKWGFNQNTTLYRIIGNNEELKKSIEASKNLEELKEELKDEFRESATRDERLLETIEKLNQEIENLSKIGERVESLLDNYTGLVIVAPGMDIEEIMYSEIYYEDGDEQKLLYGPNDGRGKTEGNLVYFYRNLTDASRDELVRDNPYKVIAIGIGRDNSSILISAEDAELVEKINKATNILAERRVAIVK